MSSCLFRPLDTTKEEIRSISTILDLSDDRDPFIARAEAIADEFFKYNNLINPITLARSSCYIALKSFVKNPESHISVIRANGGHENKWFIYLTDVIEKELNIT